MTRKSDAALLLLAALLAASVSRAEPRTLGAELAGYGLALSDGGAPVVRNFRRSAAGRTRHTLAAERDGRRYEMEIVWPVPPAEAAKFSDDKYALVQSLYRWQPTSYPGERTHLADCPPEKRPVTVEADVLGTPVRVLLANASSDHVLGVWDDDLIKTRAAFLIFYDEPARRQFQVKIFEPAEAFSREKILEILRSFRRAPPR